MRLWQRKPREQVQPVQKPAAPKRPKSGEELREAFLRRLDARPDDKQDERL